jgi:outer membrane protein TolC
MQYVKNKKSISMNRFSIFFLLVGFSLSVHAQDRDFLTADDSLSLDMVSSGADTLSLDEALMLGLEKNHNIIIARQQANQAENNIFIGNAGFLPRINLTGAYQKSVQDTYIEFAGDMPPIDREGAASTTYNAAVELSYTLFDGLSRFYQYDRLQELGRRADIQTRLTVENTLFQLVQTYLQIARLRENYEINQQSAEISLQRYQRAKNAYRYGGDTKLDVLNAKVDLNTDSVNLAQSYVDLNNAKRDLNILMGRAPTNSFIVNDNFDINLSIEIERIMEKALENNANLQVAEYNLNLARLDEKISGAARYPGLNLNGSYGYNRQENEAGFIASQEQLGFQGGISLNYTLFDANVRSTQIQNAEISTQNEQQRLSFTRQQIRRDVLNAFATYQNSLYLLDKEEDNLETARLNFERSQTALRLGQINTTQFREAQLNLINARRRINRLYYQTKLAEVRLYRLAGVLSD